MHTFLNLDDKPIIRTCGNCIFFKPISNDVKSGYCTRQPTMFAYTMQHTVFDIKMKYYLCESHKLMNEQWLEENAQRVDLRSVLKEKGELDKDRRKHVGHGYENNSKENEEKW